MIKICKASYKVTACRKTAYVNFVGIDMKFFGIFAHVIDAARQLCERQRVACRRDVVS